MENLAGQAIALAGLAYESPGRPDGWDAFLRGIGDTIGASAPGVYLTHRTSDRMLLAATRGVEARWGAAYEQHFARLDLRRRRIHSLAEGTAFVGAELVPDRALEASEFYADFLRPQGYFQLLGAVFLRTDDEIGVLRVVRARNAPPFDHAHRTLLAQLAPHLRRSLIVDRHLAVAAARRDAAHDVLDRFLVGVLLVDGRGRVCAANRQAERILDLQDGLRVDRDGLRAATAADTNALRALVAATATHAPSGGALTLARPSGRDPLGVLVTPLRAAALSGLTRTASALVLVTDPAQQPAPTTARLRRHLGLTAAEAAVAVLVAQGHRVDDVAEQLGLSPHTTRTQLKHALARTGRHRQSELVRLVLATATIDDRD